MIRVLCCGGRDFTDQNFVNARLDQLREKYGDFAIVHGGARGADTCWDFYGRTKGLPVAVVNANWSFYDKKAGPVRNRWMLELFQPNMVVAFPGGAGTRDMISISKLAGVVVWEL